MPVRSTAFEKFSFLKQILGLTDGSSFAKQNESLSGWVGSALVVFIHFVARVLVWHCSSPNGQAFFICD